MRKPNGYGCIKKLSGKRRRPYVFLISAEGKQKPISYFCTQAEAEIYAAEYNKKHTNKILHGHQITFSELYYRWLPFQLDSEYNAQKEGFKKDLDTANLAGNTEAVQSIQQEFMEFNKAYEEAKNKIMEEGVE